MTLLCTVLENASRRFGCIPFYSSLVVFEELEVGLDFFRTLGDELDREHFQSWSPVRTGRSSQPRCRQLHSHHLARTLLHGPSTSKLMPLRLLTHQLQLSTSSTKSRGRQARLSMAGTSGCGAIFPVCLAHICRLRIVGCLAIPRRTPPRLCAHLLQAQTDSERKG